MRTALGLSVTERAIRRRPPPEALRWVEDAVGAGSRITALRRLGGGSSHANHAVDVVDRRGDTHRLVLRRWARPDWSVYDPDFDARREVAVLSVLVGSAVIAPRLVAADPDATVCDVPALLLTRLPGHPPGPPRDIRTFLAQLAAPLPAIHAVGAAARTAVPPYRPWNALEDVEPPAWARQPRVWRRAIALAATPPPATPACFIHRDYHPGNTLWLRGRLTGVVDWTSGSWGPVAVDLAHMRWNLAAQYGRAAADQFLAAYRALAGPADAHHPYWDVRTVLDLLPDLDPTRLPSAQFLARLEEHVAAALASL